MLSGTATIFFLLQLVTKLWTNVNLQHHYSPSENNINNLSIVNTDYSIAGTSLVNKQRELNSSIGRERAVGKTARNIDKNINKRTERTNSPSSTELCYVTHIYGRSMGVDLRLSSYNEV